MGVKPMRGRAGILLLFAFLEHGRNVKYVVFPFPTGKILSKIFRGTEDNTLCLSRFCSEGRGGAHKHDQYLHSGYKASPQQLSRGLQLALRFFPIS